MFPHIFVYVYVQLYVAIQHMGQIELFNHLLRIINIIIISYLKPYSDVQIELRQLSIPQNT